MVVAAAAWIEVGENWNERRAFMKRDAKCMNGTRARATTADLGRGWEKDGTGGCAPRDDVNNASAVHVHPQPADCEYSEMLLFLNYVNA